MTAGLLVFLLLLLRYSPHIIKQPHKQGRAIPRPIERPIMSPSYENKKTFHNIFKGMFFSQGKCSLILLLIKS